MTVVYKCRSTTFLCERKRASLYAKTQQWITCFSNIYVSLNTNAIICLQTLILLVSAKALDITLTA